jgi:hypothetical protein
MGAIMTSHRDERLQALAIGMFCLIGTFAALFAWTIMMFGVAQ